ncbi:MAG: hypothetical protein K6T74_05955 [Geminicoccaceae bacterium]|nr:hypothetical protein [Geminicoccaceae bacterium]
MLPNLLRIFVLVVRRLARRWPRELVLRGSGEPVRLLVDTPVAADGACLVETGGGEVRLVRPEELASRPRGSPEVVPLLLALALAASVATLAALPPP